MRNCLEKGTGLDDLKPKIGSTVQAQVRDEHRCPAEGRSENLCEGRRQGRAFLGMWRHNLLLFMELNNGQGAED